MTVAINTSNLHAGGGIQVAVSFLHELSLMKDVDFLFLHIFASTEVADALSRLNTNTNTFGHFEIVDSYGIKALFSNLNNRLKNYDVVFTIFGPNYLRVKAKKEIVGFAQLWILNFDNPISRRMSFLQRNLLRLKYYLQWLFFLRADHYVVELEHVKSSLIANKGVESEKISVAYNTVSSLYQDKGLWKPVSITKNKEEFSLGFVTRDYPHKNLDILPSVAEKLELQHNLKVHFYTTLNETEWATKNETFRQHVSTVGSLSPDQCPSFYEQVDAVVFPSLLECFSASPLEALVMCKPLFASDRSFVRDVCGDYAMYFDPLDSGDIARNIAAYFKSDINHAEQLQQARNHALSFSSAKGRAEKYLEIIQQHLKG